MSSKMKICMLGDASVGKTCIVSRFVKDIFDNEESATIAANFVETSITTTNKTIDVAIWDTAGQEKYRSMVGMYYRQSNGAVIVYDITNLKSFEHIEDWYKDLKASCPEVAIALIGNKSDDKEHRCVTAEEGSELAKKLKIPVFFEVSALNGESLFFFEKKTFRNEFESRRITNE